MLITPAMIRAWTASGLPLTNAPINDPALNAARNVVIRLAQTKIEVPKNGASTREATSCRPMLKMPRQKIRKKRIGDMPGKR